MGSSRSQEGGSRRRDEDVRFMERAIELARRGVGRTRPNPAVGCVIVRAGEVIGEGFHACAGGPHAETRAIESLGDPGEVRGAQVYINLEPCSHHGRTPPCTDRLVELGPRRVVISMIDPDPRVSGRGVERLQEAGIEVEIGVLEERARALNAPYIKRTHTGLPWVTAKWAMTLDGKIATRTGDAAWISNEISRRRVHEMRDTHDAILVGHGTLVRDDPRLTCRLEGGRDPVRVVLDARLEIADDARVLPAGEADTGEAEVLVVCGEGVAATRRERLERRAGVEAVEVAVDERGWLDLEGVMRALSERGLSSVLVEGGGQTIGSLLDARLVDRVVTFVAPKIVGGRQAPTPAGGRGVEAMVEACELVDVRTERLGDDIMIEGEVDAGWRAYRSSDDGDLASSEEPSSR